MNLETRLDPRLWEAIRESIEARKFTAAILDAIHILSEVIRERSGLEGDGVALIGGAFGGATPKLKVNRLQTESEQNVQRGIEALLRGMYQAIRNPRSHGTYQDDEHDAVAILVFLDYLLRVVDQSRSPFSLPTFVARVLDTAFVPKERYAALLVDEIPAPKRLSVCLEVFARRQEADEVKLNVFFDAILRVMSDEEVGEFYEILSDELRQTDDDKTIRFVIRALPSDLWVKLSEISRLRIENKLIESAKEGKWVERQRRIAGGALGTWSGGILESFTLKEDLWRAVFIKLGSSDRAEQNYAFRFFLPHVEACFDAPPRPLISAVKRGLKAGDIRFKRAAASWQIGPDFEERDSNDPWQKLFATELASFAEAPEVNSDDDDVPF